MSQSRTSSKPCFSCWHVRELRRQPRSASCRELAVADSRNVLPFIVSRALREEISSRCLKRKYCSCLRGDDWEWWANSSPALLWESQSQFRASVCLWRGSEPRALINPTLPRNVTGSAAARVFTFIFSSLYTTSSSSFFFLISLFFVLSHAFLGYFFLSLFLLLFVLPAADCCPSNLCSRLGTFSMLLMTLSSCFFPTPPVSLLAHSVPLMWSFGFALLSIQGL